MASIIKSNKFRGRRKDAEEHIHKLDKSPAGSGWFLGLNVKLFSLPTLAAFFLWPNSRGFI
jgi:hypothetical protein